jgi:hypothetical protein
VLWKAVYVSSKAISFSYKTCWQHICTWYIISCARWISKNNSKMTKLREAFTGSRYQDDCITFSATMPQGCTWVSGKWQHEVVADSKLLARNDLLKHISEWSPELERAVHQCVLVPDAAIQCKIQLQHFSFVLLGDSFLSRRQQADFAPLALVTWWQKREQQLEFYVESLCVLCVNCEHILNNTVCLKKNDWWVNIFCWELGNVFQSKKHLFFLFVETTLKKYCIASESSGGRRFVLSMKQTLWNHLFSMCLWTFDTIDWIKSEIQQIEKRPHSLRLQAS